MAEGLAAGTALKGLLPGVDEVVADQRGALAEGFPTLSAFVGVLSVVDPSVPDDV